MFVRHVYAELDLGLAMQIEAVCPKCRTWQPWVGFEKVEAFWPDEFVCSECADKWAADEAENEKYGQAHGGACGCGDCC